MRTRYGLIGVVLCCVLGIGFSVTGSAIAAKKPIQIRLVIATPEMDMVQTFRDKEMAKRFNERAKGEYEITVYAGGALAKLPEYFDAVRIGAVEMQFSNWGFFSFVEPRLELLETPFLFDNNEATSAATKRMLPLYDPILKERFNAKGLAMMSTGGLGLWSQNPIESMDALKGKLVASVTQGTSTMLEALGTSPVTIVFTDMYSSLQKKVVDAATMSAHGGVALSFTDVCKHYTAVYCMPAPAGYTINLDVWNKMPSHIQEILTEETMKAAEWMDDVVINKLPDMDLEVFEDKGVAVHYLSKKEREEWVKAVRPLVDKKLEKYGELGRQMRKIADEVNQQYPYAPNKVAL